jgi:hypothetical protein
LAYIQQAMVVVRVVVFIAGLAVVLATFGSAVRTVVLPRAIPSKLTRWVFLTMRFLFRLRAGRMASYERRDRIMALYAPVSLLMTLLVWVTLVLLGYAAMYWGLGGRSVREAITLSGSSIYTLGFVTPGDLPSTIMAFTEAGLGLVLLALLITYLPSLYNSFSRREQAVSMLEVRAGSPPSGAEMIERFARIKGIEELNEVWKQWELWFVDVEETHTSFPALTFFRSPQPNQSWVTAAGAVLDGASLRASTLDLPRDPDCELCIRAGYIALRRIATFFRIPYDPDPRPDDPISIMRDEYDDVYDRLVAQGIPVKIDRDQAWRDFAGWRVNYDTVLLALAVLTDAPVAPWSSDRSFTRAREPVPAGRFRRRR